jgi:hypothetical protein
VASSTTRRFGDFFRSRIAVEKSFFAFLRTRPQTKHQQANPPPRNRSRGN